MSISLDMLVQYSKRIIFLCLFALFVAQIAVHRFDPSHPKALTNECIQTTVTMLQKNGWIVWLAVVAASLWRRHDLGTVLDRFGTSSPSFRKNELFVDDPIRRALREGRLRRLTYH